MEKYDDALRALQAILPTQLLAKSWLDLAQKLGIDRKILYSIRDGKVRLSAFENILVLLNEQLNVDIPALLRMEAAIKNVADFTKVIKPEMNLEYPD